MPKKMLNPKTTITFLPAASITNPLLPSIAVLNGASAKNLSLAIVRGYTLNPTDSDTDDSASIGDSGNVTNPIRKNYEAEITFFRDADNNAAPTTVYNLAWNLFLTVDQSFWIVRRLGKLQSATYAIGDWVELYLVNNDRMRSLDAGDDGPIQFTVPFLSQGNYSGYVQTVA